MAATKDNAVKFVYVSTGALPAQVDLDTIYFVAGVGLYVGGELIANDGLTEADIADFGVKTVTVTGEGTAIVNASLGNDGTLTLTKGVPFTLAKGSDTTGTAQTLTPGGTFTAMTDTTVSGGDTISDQNTTFTMPDAITDVTVSQGTNNGEIKATVTWSNGTTTNTEAAVKGLGSAAFTNDTDYATAAQGILAENAMPSTNGTATGATITLAADPTTNMQAATKQYVDTATAGLSGAMHFIGTSTTAITDGGTETPTIGGETVTPTNGDVVLYSGKEFVWDGSAWELLGDEGSYALKTVAITGDDGLQGGGNLTSDRTITHAVPTGASAGDKGSDAALTFLKKVTTDKFGHVTGATTGSVTIPEYEFADNYDASTNKGATVATVTNAINELDVTGVGGAGSYISAISETDGLISATVGTKGTIAANDTNLVDGDTVNTAIETVRSDLAVLWDVINS